MIFKVALALMACKSKRRRGNLAGVLERGGRVDAQLPTKRYLDLRGPTANCQVLQLIVLCHLASSFDLDPNCAPRHLRHLLVPSDVAALKPKTITHEVDRVFFL